VVQSAADLTWEDDKVIKSYRSCLHTIRLTKLANPTAPRMLSHTIQRMTRATLTKEEQQDYEDRVWTRVVVGLMTVLCLAVFAAAILPS
jgi:hypothetical protein